MKVMERIGLHTGHFNVEASRFAELVRISGVGYKATEKAKIRRKKLHAQKKGYDNVSNKGLWGRDALIILLVLYTLGYKYLFYHVPFAETQSTEM